jgi:hypothetical protein
MPAEKKVTRRVRGRDECERTLPRIKPGYHGKVVIRDIARLSMYPISSVQGTSAWYRSELTGFYHRGLEIILGTAAGDAAPEIDERGHERWRWVIRGASVPGQVSAVTVGQIPFEWIEQIDWNGDEYYSDPHIYCRFIGPWWGPCEAVIYKAKFPNSDYLRELEGLRAREPGPWGRMKLWYPERLVDDS